MTIINEREPLRGHAPVGVLLWLLALSLFVLPFFGEADALDDTSAEGWIDWPRVAVNAKEEGLFDIPFEQAVGDFGEDYSLDLAGFIEAESEQRFGLESEFLAATSLVDVARVRAGERSYFQYCVGCHGASGDGSGPAARYLNPRPRNFRKGIFKFTSTSSGSRPLRADLFGTITRGLTGSSMPDFRLLSEEKRWDLAEYVRYLAVRGEFEQLTLDFSRDDEALVDAQEVAELVAERWSPASTRPVYPAAIEPDFDAASIERGRQSYMDGSRANCAACHGKSGTGDGPSATAFEDAWGYRVQPRDLTGGIFRAGSTSGDLYMSIATGINGTPMPSFRDSFDAGEIWDLTHFVQSLEGSH